MEIFKIILDMDMVYSLTIDIFLGLMTYQDRYYIGFWKNDKKHGLGKEVLDKGD